MRSDLPRSPLSERIHIENIRPNHPSAFGDGGDSDTAVKAMYAPPVGILA